MTRKTLWDHTVIFLAGFVWDSVLSVDTVLTAHFSVGGAITITLIGTFLSYLVYDKIIENAKVNWRKVLTLAAGSSTGAGITTLIMQRLYQ